MNVNSTKLVNQYGNVNSTKIVRWYWSVNIKKGKEKYTGARWHFQWQPQGENLV